MSHHPYKNQKKKERKKEGNASKVKQVANWSVYFKGLVFFFAAGFRKDFN